MNICLTMTEFYLHLFFFKRVFYRTGHNHPILVFISFMHICAFRYKYNFVYIELRNVWQRSTLFNSECVSYEDAHYGVRTRSNTCVEINVMEWFIRMFKNVN